MDLNSLEFSKYDLERLLTSNPNRSLSGVYKSLRRLAKFKFIGNYPLLSYILFYSHYRSPQYFWNRNQVLRAVRISYFYKDEDRKEAYIPKEWERFLKK